MAKTFAKTLADAPTATSITSADLRILGRRQPVPKRKDEEKPRALLAKRKPVWVYLTEREKYNLENAAIDAEQSLSEYIRDALKKTAKI